MSGAEGGEDVKPVARGGQRALMGDGAGSRQTPFWICSECGNMLHPKEDKAQRVLKRVCRNCKRTDLAESNLVNVNDMRPEARAVDQGADTIKDPTLPRANNTECGSCGTMTSVFFQAPMKQDEGMKLIFMCTNCAYKWKQ
uniref:TFIIS-type domain-containing protein n=1 Tax=Coccolithus braarudii TaxID=221442 RepID=A0A7S0PXR3_9EUKA|mmetsp:Transcript_19987/g.43024  ORF Transcript_19987/g.43024 Transcript_19987/m.43024 type:complete len:141 (+) Transcript_19987:183-605(+)